MTDARIITREVLLELANDIYRTAFEAGFEAGSLVSCLEKSEPASEFVPLKHLKLKENQPRFTAEPTTFTFTSTPDTITKTTNEGG